jgi:hypothetical protein
LDTGHPLGQDLFELSYAMHMDSGHVNRQRLFEWTSQVSDKAVQMAKNTGHLNGHWMASSCLGVCWGRYHGPPGNCRGHSHGTVDRPVCSALSRLPLNCLCFMLLNMMHDLRQLAKCDVRELFPFRATIPVSRNIALSAIVSLCQWLAL